MSSGDKSRKTEQPTPRRLQEARRRGRVIKSREITSTAIILAAMAFFYLRWESMIQQLEEITILSTTLFDFAFTDALKRMFDLVLSGFYDVIVPFIVTVTLAGVIAHIAQFGFLISWAAVSPKVEHLDPFQGAKRIFAFHNLFETAKAAFKAVVIVAIVAVVLYDGMESLLLIPHCDVNCERGMLEALSGRVGLYLVPFIVLLALVDYVYQRRHYLREHRMTLEEVRRERRDAEGSPELLGRRRQKQREGATSGPASAASEASVVATGQDLAVVLYYDRDETPLPVVTLIANGDAARAAIATALAHEVPVVERPEYAQALARDAREGEYIPTQFLRPTAELLSQLSAPKSA